MVATFLATLPLEQPLALTTSADPVINQTERRHLPGKRRVFAGHWRDASVLIKYHHAARHAHREVQGWRRLMAAGIPTPALIHQDTMADAPIHVLIYQFLDGAENFDSVWQRLSTPEAQKHALKQLLRITALMHQAGIWQHDFHARNILVHQQQIYMIDTDQIKARWRHRPLSSRQAWQNISLLFSELSITNEALLTEAMEIYCQARDWTLTAKCRRIFRHCAQQQRLRQHQKYLKKTLRSCTEFVVSSGAQKQWGYRREEYTPEIQQFLTHPEVYLQTYQDKILKQGNSSTVMRVRFGAQHYVVKRYNLKNSHHFLRRCLRPTRAVHSWQHANALYHFKFAVPLPVAFYEKRWCWLRRHAYFICADLPGQGLDQALLAAASSEERAQIMDAAVTLLHRLKPWQITHGDTKASNIFMCDGIAYFLDFDAMTLHRNHHRFERAFMQDWLRFLRNW